MCRWFAYVGDESTLLEDVLINPSHSIVRQIDSHFFPQFHKTYAPHVQNNSNTSDVHVQSGATDQILQASDAPGQANLFTNVDGFGVAYYTSTQSQFNSGGESDSARPCTYKNIRPALNDLNFRSLCAHTETQALFAHIRAAPGLTPVVETNNHPFVFGRYAFMHNGCVASFEGIRVKLLQKLSEKARRNVLGTTDSEHAAALFFTLLGDDWECRQPLEKLRDTMRETVKTLLEMIKEVPEETGAMGAHSSLNFAVTDGIQLLALRFSSSPEQEPPSLYYSTKAGITLNRKYPDHPDGQEAAKAHKQCGLGGNKMPGEHGKHVIVASEPSTYKEEEWELVPRDNIVLVDDKREVKLELIDL
ncbi:hypothetical protein YB2330_003500 [Saitoella coloradoensis]